jgi:hypothetical protein
MNARGRKLLREAAKVIDENAGALRACNSIVLPTRAKGSQRRRWDSLSDRAAYEYEKGLAGKLRAMARS